MAKKILIVDDEINIVISLEFLMQQAGYDVAIAYDGEVALAEVARFEPDIILLDIMLPILNGFDVCRRVRNNTAWDNVKIVMLTAKGREAEMTKGMALGANAYVTKPFSTQALLETVTQLLQ